MILIFQTISNQNEKSGKLHVIMLSNNESEHRRTEFYTVVSFNEDEKFCHVLEPISFRHRSRAVGHRSGYA